LQASHTFPQETPGRPALLHFDLEKARRPLIVS
jgi:hypothetical protein